MTGSPPSKPTTSPTCTPSPAVSGHDYDAVLNGLTFTWSSGVVEGNVNRIKMIKRQMYSRASFPLFRKRVLLAT